MQQFRILNYDLMSQEKQEMLFKEEKKQGGNITGI